MAKAGRPETHPFKKVVGFSAEMMIAIERWQAKQRAGINLSEAIRRLVEIGLSSSAPAKNGSSSQRKRAAELAERQIDKLVGDAPNAAIRKRRLIDGPSTIQDVRIDRPQKK